jgi:7-cyano-7-deazaguanine synthase
MKALISLSGGLDSAVVLADLIEKKIEVQAVSFCYGSKHQKHEIDAAIELAYHYKVPILSVDLSRAFGSVESALLASNDAKIPEGHYNDESMRQTVVPARNMIFLSVLASIALSRGCEQIYIGVHQGDHFIYPDCRPVFIRSMRKSIGHATENKVELRAPFLCKKKKDIVARGLMLNVPFEKTRTCYTSDDVACGKCGSCVERLEAFKLCNAVDPIPYQYSTYYQTEEVK